MFWVLKRTVPLRLFLEYPEQMILLRNKKKNICYTLLIVQHSWCKIVNIIYQSVKMWSAVAHLVEH